MKKNVKFGLAIGAAVVVIACILLIPFSTINVDYVKTFGDPTILASILSSILDNIGTSTINSVNDIIGPLKDGGFPSAGIKIGIYIFCGYTGISSVVKDCYTLTDSTTDTFDLVSGSKTLSAKLNVKKLFAALNKLPDNPTTLQVKTNLLHTMYEV